MCCQFDLWLLGGRCFENNDFTYFSTNGCSNCDQWLGTKQIVETGKGWYISTGQSDHVILGLNFDISCNGEGIDELEMVERSMPAA